MQDRKNSFYPVRLKQHAVLELPRVATRLYGVRFYKPFIFTVTAYVKFISLTTNTARPTARNFHIKVLNTI
jgi:hypothetical protein